MFAVSDPRAAGDIGLEDTLSGVMPGGRTRGALISRYVVLELVGSGAMGSVYAAWDPQLTRRVAVKLVQGDPGRDATDRLLTEARALAQLSHPNVVQVFDAGEIDGQVFLAMEFVEGHSLADFAREPHPLPERLAALRAAGRGLAAAHAAGIAHRDFKPANVMVGRDGRVRVVDFGLARETRAVARQRVESGELHAAPLSAARPVVETRSGGIVGTPRYMAPEQFRGERADARSDQFAFCVTAWELLFGAFPFEGTDFETLRAAVLGGRPQRAPENVVPPLSVAALQRGLSLDPAARFASMDALLEALMPPAPTRRLPWAVVAVGAVVLAFGVRVGARELECRQVAQASRSRFSDDDVRAIAAAFVATKLPYAQETAERSSAALRSWVSLLADSSSAACRDTSRWTPPTPLELDRQSCLDTSSQQLTVLVQALRAADAKTVENASRAVGNLPDVARCGAGRQALEQPTDEAQRTTAAALRASLAQSTVQADLGRLEPAKETVRGALEQARVLRFGPLLAAASLQAAKVHFEVGDFLEASARAQEAVTVGLEVRADELALEGAVVACRAATKRDAAADAKTWLALAQSLDVRLGRQPALSAQVLEAEGLAARTQSRFEDAVAAMQKARRLADEAHLPALSLAAAAGQAAALQRLSRCAEAEPVFREALQSLEQSAGPNHVRLSPLLNNLALCVSMRAPDEARALYERAWAITSAAAPNTPLAAAPTMNLAEFELRRGDAQRASVWVERARAAVAPLGPKHAMAAFATGIEAKWKLLSGDVAGAEAGFRAGLAVIEQTRGAGAADTADFLLGLGLCAAARGEDDEASRQLTLALSRFEQATVTPYSRVEAQLAMARLARRRGDTETSARFVHDAEAGLVVLGALGERLRAEASRD